MGRNTLVESNLGDTMVVVVMIWRATESRLVWVAGKITFFSDILSPSRTRLISSASLNGGADWYGELRLAFQVLIQCHSEQSDALCQVSAYSFPHVFRMLPERPWLYKKTIYTLEVGGWVL